MPRAKTTGNTPRKAMKQTRYRCVRSVSYPASAAVRQRIKGGEKVPAEEREPWARHAIGETLSKRDLPPEVFAACIRRGLIEAVGAKEASDDAEK